MFCKSKHEVKLDNFDDDYIKTSKELIKKLSSPARVSVEDMSMVFREVIMGHLEWTYHESDGEYK